MGLADAVGRDLALRLGVTRQRGRPPLWWPWAPSLPGLGPSASQRSRRGAAILVTVGLLVVLSIAIIGIVGSFHRLPPPIGPARPGLIAFDTGGDIVVANVDGTGRRQLTSSAEMDIQPTFSPDGTRIAFQSLAHGGAIVELVVMDADGAHRMTVATKPASGSAQDTSIDWRLLSWSPDGRALAYTGLAGGRPQVFVAQADGSGSTLIGDRALEGQDPAWSPDGARIAFRGGRYDNDRGLYVMNADGSGVRRLTTEQEDAAGGAYSYFAPMWSPDEGWIAYTTVPAGLSSKQVWVVGVDDGVERAISTASGWNDAPSWSPDGSRIAYFTSPGADTTAGRFVVVKPDGSGEIQLSPPVGGSPAGVRSISGNDAPTWSPDGTKLIGRLYETTFPYSSSIVVIDIAKGTLTVLPPSGSNDADFIEIPGLPSWQRLAP